MSFDNSQPSYTALRDIVSQRTRSFVAWTGAGFSASANLPSWARLRELLTLELDNAKHHRDDEGKAQCEETLARLSSEPDPWLAFEYLEDCMGHTAFKAAIRKHINPSDTADTSLYERLWRLNFSGCVTLNLDRLVSRAYARVHPGSVASEFPGKRSADYLHLLQSAAPFVTNLHGTLDNAGSWVFTRKSLSSLYRNDGYLALLEGCIVGRTVVFFGISADDPAAGGHLERLVSKKFELGEHFWVTHRNDRDTLEYADKIGLRVIHYSAPDGDHSEVIEMFDDLSSHCPDEITPHIVVPSIPSGVEGQLADLPSVDKIERLPSADIRQLLNSHAKRILSSDDGDRGAQYQAFLSDYESAIHRAWFVSTRPPNNDVLGTRLVAEAQRGGFGRVYRAIGKSGENLAVKILHQEIRDHPGAMESFRRGVGAMKILSESNVSGMVPYLEAYEIPACAIMDFVEGPNLREATEQQLVSTWHEILEFSCQLASIIHSAHSLPEKVLHRDIRPANIMLKDYYTENDIQVVVLDFDLSWHRDAMGVSIENPNSTSGYVAPEQIEKSISFSTRNALVDSFGLGMTLYYVLSKQDPLFGQPRHADWRDVLAEVCRNNPCLEWNSLPRRFARIIEWATKYEQNVRWDMSQIYGELQRIKAAMSDPLQMRSAELLTEELASSCQITDGYDWDRDSYTASFVSPAGVSIGIRGDEHARLLRFRLAWVKSASDTFRSVKKYVPRSVDQATSALQKNNWKVTQSRHDNSGAVIEAECSVYSVANNMKNCAKLIDSIFSQFSFR